MDWVIIVRDDFPVIDSPDIICVALSDHRNVFCELSRRKPNSAKQQVTSRNLRRIYPTSFQTDVCQVVSSFAQCPDREVLGKLNASLRNVLDRHAPLVIRTVIWHARPLRGSPRRSKWPNTRAQELCESGGSRPGLPSLISLRFL